MQTSSTSQLSHMFQLLLLIAVTCFSMSGFAQEIVETELDQDQISKIAYVEKNFRRKDANDADLVTALEKNGLVDVTESFEPVVAQLHIAHVLVSNDLDRVVTFRYDFTLKDQTQMGRLIKLSHNEFVLHTKNGNQRHVAIFFQGFTQTEINPIALKVSQFKATRATAASQVIGLIIPRANANEKSGCNSGSTSMLKVARGRLVQSGALVVRSLSVCSKSFMAADGDSLDLGVSSLFNGDWLTGMKKTFGAFKYLITQGAASMVAALGESVSHLSAELLTAVLCYSMASVAANYVVGLATGGIGLPVMLLNVVKKIKKVANIISSFTETRVVRNVRYLSSALEGKTPTARLREGDLLTLLTKGGEPMGLVGGVKKSQTWQMKIEKTLRQSTCVARLESGSRAQHGGRNDSDNSLSIRSPASSEAQSLR